MPWQDYLDTAGVTEIRALVADTFPDAYEVLRETRTDTDEGGWTNVEAVAGTGACRLRPVGESAQERQIVERRQWEVAYSIDLPYAVDLTPADRLRVNGVRSFEVGGVVKAGTWGFWATAVCREIG